MRLTAIQECTVTSPHRLPVQRYIAIDRHRLDGLIRYLGCLRIYSDSKAVAVDLSTEVVEIGRPGETESRTIDKLPPRRQHYLPTCCKKPSLERNE